MREITLILIRHSKSCANHARDIAGTHDLSHPLVAASQEIRDPALSAHGAAMARAYGPTLRSRLQRASIQLTGPDVLVGSSGLQRACDTAKLLFPTVSVTHLSHIMEFGNIPENTPTRLRREKPDFRAFLRHLHDLSQSTFIVVAHGSFLRSEAWPIVSPRRPDHARFGNLDAFVVRTGLTEDGRLLNPKVTDLPWAGRKPAGGDRCSHRVERMIRTHTHKTGGNSRKMTRRHVRTRKQKGGATGLPLAWYQQGAQFQGTVAEPTGVGLAGSSASWARSALPAQGGGRRRRTHRRQQGGIHDQRSGVTDHLEQMGGFSPSVMGAGFASVGMRLLPAAAYMGYNQFQNYSKQRKRTQRR
jgi:broad specificity phosphatase PhoE